MVPRQSLTGRLAATRLLGSALWRRLLLALALAICAVLALFPQPYLAVVTLTPTDPASLGLSQTLGQLGAVQSVFGNQTAIEVSLRVAQSDYVRGLVDDRIKLEQRLGADHVHTLRWLDHNVDVRALRGGIIQFSIKLDDPKLAKEIIAAYADAVREQLAKISRTQTAYKRKILSDLVQQSSEKLAVAQAAYDTFRLQTRYSSPQAAISAIGDRVPKLEDAIKHLQVDLNAARQFFTDDNLHVRQIEAQITALRQQLADAQSTSPVDLNSVGRVVRQSTEVDRLRRELDLAQSLYDSYKRYLQGTSLEDLTATANIRILEPAYIEAQRQYNMPFLLLGLVMLLLGLTIEGYLLRMPVGAARGA